MKRFTLKLIRILWLLIFFLEFQALHAKKHQVHFHQSGNELLITLNETEEGMVGKFYYIQSENPLPQRLLKDGQYKISVTNNLLFLKSKERTLIFCVNQDIVQAAFRQAKVIYLLVNGIVYGELKEPVSPQELMARFMFLKKADLNQVEFSSVDIQLAVCRNGFKLYCDPDKTLCKCFREEESEEDQSGE